MRGSYPALGHLVNLAVVAVAPARMAIHAILPRVGRPPMLACSPVDGPVDVASPRRGGLVGLGCHRPAPPVELAAVVEDPPLDILAVCQYTAAGGKQIRTCPGIAVRDSKLVLVAA